MTRPSATLTVPRWVKQLGTLPEEVTREALAETQDSLRSALKKNASKGGSRGLNVRSGRLINSIRTYLKATPDGAELTAGSVFYGWVHNRGAVITPKKAPRLRFFIPGVGWRTAMRVVLPKRPWVDDALEDARKEYRRHMVKALERYTRA